VEGRRQAADGLNIAQEREEKYTEIDTKQKKAGLTATGEEKHSRRGEAAQRGGMGGRHTCRR
jgi:hypothetical protein